MSRAIESTNVAAVDTKPMSSQSLANEVADLILHKHSPIAAADDFLKQVAMRSCTQQNEFVNRFENDLNKQYGQIILPNLLIFSEQIGQSGHNTASEVALSAATHDTLQQIQAQAYSQGREDARSINGASFNRNAIGGSDNAVNGLGADRNAIGGSDNNVNGISRDRNAIGGSDNSVNSIGRDRNAIDASDNSVNGIGADRNAIGGSDNSVNGIGRDRNAIDDSNRTPPHQGDKFAGVETFLYDNPLIRDWMERSCGTNEITQADLKGLLSRHRTRLDPASESVYKELAVLNENWNNPEFSQIQSTFPHTNIKYLDMGKVMDTQPAPSQIGSENPYSL